MCVNLLPLQYVHQIVVTGLVYTCVLRMHVCRQLLALENSQCQVSRVTHFSENQINFMLGGGGVTQTFDKCFITSELFNALHIPIVIFQWNDILYYSHSFVCPFSIGRLEYLFLIWVSAVVGVMEWTHAAW